MSIMNWTAAWTYAGLFRLLVSPGTGFQRFSDSLRVELFRGENSLGEGQWSESRESPEALRELGAIALRERGCVCDHGPCGYFWRKTDVPADVPVVAPEAAPTELERSRRELVTTRQHLADLHHNVLAAIGNFGSSRHPTLERLQGYVKASEELTNKLCTRERQAKEQIHGLKQQLLAAEATLEKARPLDVASLIRVAPTNTLEHLNAQMTTLIKTVGELVDAKAKKETQSQRTRLYRCIDAMRQLLTYLHGSTSVSNRTILNMINSDDQSASIEALRALVAYETNGQFGEERKP